VRAAPLLALALLAGCGKMPDSVHSALPPGPGNGRGNVGAAANAQPSASTLGAVPPTTLRAIAITEDQRRYDAELKRFLADPSPAVRARAALAVGRLQDSTTVADLLPLLNDSSAEVRREAVFALGQVGQRSARVPIQGRLTDPDPETVDLAIEALGKLGDKSATPLIAAFMRSGAPQLRGEAAVALWRLADSTALAALLEDHADPDPDVRWRVLYALEKVVAPERVVLVAALHLNDPEWLTRAYAARTMGRQKSTRATAYLMGALRDVEPPVVVNSIRAIQQIADSTTRGVTAALVRQLSHRDPYVRVTVATALADRFAFVGADSAGRVALVDSLRAHLADRDAATRGAVARALIARGSESDLTAAEAMMSSDPSIYARVAVMGAWPRASTLLPWLATGQPLFIRTSAADRLGELKARGAAPALRAGLADSSVLFVASCAGALAALGDSASLKSLARAYADRAGDADADARIAIRDAVRELAGRAFADSLERLHPQRNAMPASYPDDFADPPAARGAILHTTAGDIEWAFYGSEAPQTVKNFVRLAERGYFDGLLVHRVVPNFVIQDGDPTGTGSGGPGYTIRCEYNRLRYDHYMVGMALSGKDTGGSQWFITQSPQLHLNGRYTIFARVVRGEDVVWHVVQGERVTKVEILKQPAPPPPRR
jgi:HEAT repeat protein/cyclophilin family peptidyl-prolyl cis-trans isomerase